MGGESFFHIRGQMVIAGGFSDVFLVTNSLTVISSARNLLMQGRPKPKKQALSNATKKAILRRCNKWTMMNPKIVFGSGGSTNMQDRFIKLTPVRLNDTDSVTSVLKW